MPLGPMDIGIPPWPMGPMPADDCMDVMPLGVPVGVGGCCRLTLSGALALLLAVMEFEKGEDV